MVQMDIYENFYRMAKLHVATIRECEVLTEPTSTNYYEYDNEIAVREADRLAKEVARGLKGKSIEQIYNILKGYR